MQLRRAGAGTALVDPMPLRSDLSALAPALAGPEWVLHAATQDLPCLAEVGLAPGAAVRHRAGRAAGSGSRGSASARWSSSCSGCALEKGHGAADWSRRPLPEDWLVYAALDVEVLVELRDVLAELLDEQGKLDWARQEFEAVRTAPPPAPRAEPWRRTSGIHHVRKPRALAAVRALWEARDRLAAERDIAPGRVLPDAAIVDAARRARRDARGAGRAAGVPRARAAAADRLLVRGARPGRRASTPTSCRRAAPPSDGPPPVTRWADRDPAAAARLAAARAAVADGVRGAQRAGGEPAAARPAAAAVLEPAGRRRRPGRPAAGGAREWQIELLAPLLEPALHP